MWDPCKIFQNSFIHFNVSLWTLYSMLLKMRQFISSFIVHCHKQLYYILTVEKMETTDPLEIVINFRVLLHCFKAIVVDRGGLWPWIFIFKNRFKKDIFQLPTPLSCSRFWHKNDQIPRKKFQGGGNFGARRAKLFIYFPPPGKYHKPPLNLLHITKNYNG